tara:strand:- start:415 stop:1155 length:741 start_codon:yes stop_codon:yes gene_type:complete
MSKFYINNYSDINLYRKKSSKSEVMTQMIYGDAFSVIKKSNKWWKIKIKEDSYVGFVKKKNFIKFVKPTHKVSKLSAKIYKKPNFKKPSGKLTFGAKIRSEEKKSRFVKFQNNWIETRNLKPIKFKNKNIFSNIKIFKNVKYKWGGKTFKGLDCSALVQLFFNFNNRYCPRDAKDQIKYLKKNINLKNIRKDDIIYWKGHVAVALSKKKLIHAYGPVKKTLIMNINKTITKITKTAKLKVLSVKRI